MAIGWPRKLCAVNLDTINPSPPKYFQCMEIVSNFVVITIVLNHTIHTTHQSSLIQSTPHPNTLDASTLKQASPVQTPLNHIWKANKHVFMNKFENQYIYCSVSWQLLRIDSDYMAIRTRKERHSSRFSHWFNLILSIAKYPDSINWAVWNGKMGKCMFVKIRPTAIPEWEWQP